MESDAALINYFESLPANLKVLDLSDLQLEHIPCILKFQSLEELIIQNNRLTFLPPFPASLKRIYCANNTLKFLPPLPRNLELIDCSNNPLLQTLPVHQPGFLINHENTGIDLNKYNGMSKQLYNLLN